jgi:YggT family protein
MIHQLLGIIFGLFELLIVARVLLSWVQLDPYNPIVQFIYNTTEPILAPIRRRLPPSGGMDLSPLVVLIAAYIVQSILLRII